MRVLGAHPALAIGLGKPGLSGQAKGKDIRAGAEVGLGKKKTGRQTGRQAEQCESLRPQPAVRPDAPTGAACA